MSRTLTSAQLRAARALLGWTVRDLSDKTGVHRNTISGLEAGTPPRASTAFALRHALEEGGVIFIEENGEGFGARLRKNMTTAE
jgi:transcriptional regulator with XRE-family HTH domain